MVKTLIFMAGLTPYGYGFLGLFLVSFLFAYFWLKSSNKKDPLGCFSLGLTTLLIWFSLMFPASFTFMVFENGNEIAKIAAIVFWVLILSLILYFRFAKSTVNAKKLIFTFFKYILYLIFLGLFLTLFFGMVYYIYERLFTENKSNDPIWVAFLCIFFVASLILAGFGFLNNGKGEKKKEKTTFYSLDKAKLKPELVVELNLSKAKLQVFPQDILQFRNLKFLVLSNNEISQVPNEINKLHQLSGIDLSNNPISDVERSRIRKLLSKEVEIIF